MLIWIRVLLLIIFVFICIPELLKWFCGTLHKYIFNDQNNYFPNNLMINFTEKYCTRIKRFPLRFKIEDYKNKWLFIKKALFKHSNVENYFLITTCFCISSALLCELKENKLFKIKMERKLCFLLNIKQLSSWLNFFLFNLK